MAKIKLNNNEYPIPDSALAPATADFVAHLGTIAGSGLKVVVGGVEYGVDASKVAGAMTGLENHFGGLNNGESGLNEYGFYYNQPYFDANAGMGIILQADGTCILFLLESGNIIPLTYTINGNEVVYVDVEFGDQFTGTLDTNCIRINVFNELEGIFILDSETVVFDGNYIYCYFEELNGYDVRPVDKTKISYNGIKSTVNGLPVEKIGDYAFFACESLEKVEITNSVTRIGKSAFEQCPSLKHIEIPSTVETLDDGVFNRCYALESVTFLEDSQCITVGPCAFCDCTSLKSIEIPANVTSIGVSAFIYCTSLVNIEFKGTIAQWNAITKGDGWNDHVPATYVQCSDGQVALS